MADAALSVPSSSLFKVLLSVFGFSVTGGMGFAAWATGQIVDIKIKAASAQTFNEQILTNQKEIKAEIVKIRERLDRQK